MSSGARDPGDIAGVVGAYETAPAVMLACEGDEMVLTSANEAARTVLGDRCQFGRPVREMAPEMFDQRTMDLVDDVVGTVYSTGRAITRPACRMEMHPEDSRSFEVFWDLTVTPWFAEDGSVRGVLAHGVDVTEATKARNREALDARKTRHDLAALHDVITLQDSLLPEWLPVLPGVEIAGRYLLAQNGHEAGGDWFDAVGLGDGRVALMVGDVVGHGVSAAATMGQLRAVTHERMTSGDDLQKTMQALDLFARQVPAAGAATVCVVVLDTSSGRMDYCTAGHPPPLVVRPALGRSRYLPHSGAAPLATTGQMTVATDRVDRGDLVVLYTDGILARPGRTLASSTVELGQLAADAAAESDSSLGSGPADRVCERALELTTGRSGYSDDIAMLAAEVTGTTSPLHLDLPADDAAVGEVLDALAEWLESMRVRELDHIVVQHAVDELVTNIVEHAYGSEPGALGAGRLTVDAELLGTGDVQIRFADAGRWRPPPSGSSRGRGLTIVRGMVDRLLVRSAETGTVATVRHRLSRPARMLTGVPTPAGRRRENDETKERFALTTDKARVRLAGPLDPGHLDDLRGAVAAAAALERVVLDLARVTRMPSAAVQALHVARQGAADRGQELVLYAPAGTTAQHVLELVRLPYVLTDPEGDPDPEF